MANFKDFFKIVEPKSQNTEYVSTSTVMSSNSWGWLNQVLKGAASRIARYNTYDQMLQDIDIARAIDIIAEEVSTFDKTSDCPFTIDYMNQENKEVDERIVLTLRAALDHWCQVHEFDAGKTFSIAKYTATYGDLFFRKKTDFKPWQLIQYEDLLGIEVNDNFEAVNYHLRGKGARVGSPNVYIVPAAGIVRFTMSDNMSKNAPFGDSVFDPVIKTWRQLRLMEDAAIIYRMVRAPERRVFYIDVGNMPPHKVKSYLEQIRTEMRQRRTPRANTTDANNVDSVYSAEEIGEDIFMSSTANGRGSRVETLPGGCFAMDTKVSLLDGRDLSIRDIEMEMAEGKELWTYSCEPITGRVVPGLITWAGVTQKSAQVMRLTLDNGEEIICTPDHKFPTYDQEYKRAHEFVVGDSLIPLRRQTTESKTKIYDPHSDIWINTEHFTVDRIFDPEIQGEEPSAPVVRHMFITQIEYLDDPIEVGTLTIDGKEQYHDYHTFALSVGVFAFNSTLGEIQDITYFRNKLYRGLRVPVSYLNGSDEKGLGGPNVNYGKAGSAYIEELRFANFCKRIQNKLEVVFDHEFKCYLNSAGINVDPNLFRLRMPDPQNFAIYRQNALDSDLLNAFGSAKDIDFLSRRYAMKRFLGMTEEEIQINEELLREEKGLTELPNVSIVQQIYDTKYEEAREVKPEEAPAEPAPEEETPGEEPAPEEEAPAEPENTEAPVEEPKLDL
jgi:hypothetical protein